jgi:MFS family permease
MVQKTRWGVVALLIFTGMLAAFQVGKAAIAVPALRDDLGMSLFAASWIVGALGALGAAIALPAGLILSLFPARRTLLIGLTVIGTGSIIGALTDSATVLLATRVIEGFGFICTILSAPRLFRLVTTERDNPLAFAMWGIYMPLGTAIMMLAGPFLIHAFGWQGLWLLNGALPLAYVFVVSRLDIPAEIVPAANRNLATNLRGGFRRPGPLLVGAAFGLYTFQYFALSSLFPALLVDRLGLAIATAGLISAGTVFANAVGNFAAGGLLRLGVPLWSILVSCFIVSSLFAFGIFNEALPVAAVAILAAISLAITGLVPASLFAAAPTIAPSSAQLAITLGLITQIGISGQLLGPTVLAAVVERYDWSMAPAVFVVTTIAGVAIALLLRGALRRAAKAT